MCCTRPIHCETLSLVTSTSAPKVDALCAYPDLFRAYLRLCPNSKLPIKHHATSIEAEHNEYGPLFTGGRVTEQACMVAGCIRNTLVKYRDLACSSKKQLVVKKQALLSKLPQEILTICLSILYMHMTFKISHVHAICPMKFYICECIIIC